MRCLSGGVGRLCVVGAGNGNDLDLAALLGTYREVHLVDIDGAALNFAARSQDVTGHPALHLHGGIDVTGVLDTKGIWWHRGTTIEESDLGALAGRPAGRVAQGLPGGFDLVASTCLLSQLMESAGHALGADHPSFGKVERAIRIGHFRLLARLVAPGGSMVVISEVAASDVLPTLEKVPEEELLALMVRLGRANQHFRWVHPAQLEAVARADPEIRSRVAGVEWVRPWRWTLHGLTYLVSGIIVRFGAIARR